MIAFLAAFFGYVLVTSLILTAAACWLSCRFILRRERRRGPGPRHPASRAIGPPPAGACDEPLPPWSEKDFKRFLKGLPR